MARVQLLCFYHILTSPVIYLMYTDQMYGIIYYGIFLLNASDHDAWLHFKSESVCSFAVFCTALYIS